MPNTPVAIGEVFADKYRVERILGEGGMGVVVAAHHLELDQPVAVKFLLDDVANQAEGAERFRREARAAAKIQSDHVVRVLDVGVIEGGIRYMVMEYLEGGDLSEELQTRGSFPGGTACRFILEAMDAVGRAHKAGIVHRDLKPANLFLARRADGTQRIKVLDFGISKSVGAITTEQMSLTKTSAWIGSPLYMAPEQMQSARDVDARADVWSLGAILYELISGDPPYEADSLPQLCNLLITTDPPHIKQRCPELADELADVIMRCLVRDPAARIQSCAELAAGLAQHATTATGSGMSNALFARTEFASEPSGVFVPESQIAGSLRPSLSQSEGHGGAQTTQTNGNPVDSETRSNWGATDTGAKKSNLLPLIAVAVLAAGAAGFFLAKANKKSAEPDELAVAGAADPEENQATPVAEEPEEPEVTKEEPPAEVPSSETPAEQSKQPQQVSIPAVRPRPRPVVRPRPRPAPKPTGSPAPSDDFAEFGGRR